MSDPTQDLLDLKDLLAQVEHSLKAEREALRQRDTDALAATAEHKLNLIQQVATYDLVALGQQIPTLPAPQRAKCDALHKTVVDAAQSVRDSNLVNGMIVRRSQQSTSEILRILSGKPRNGLYGTTGTPVAGRETSAATIATA